MELLPAIDLLGGRAVRLEQGSYDAATGYGDPVELAATFAAGGAQALHVVDLDAARSGVGTNRHILGQIVEVAGVAVQTGGGVRTLRDADELFALGIARVVLGTAALEDPQAAREIIEAHPGRVVLGLDYRRGPHGELEPYSRGWTAASATTVGKVLEDFGDLEVAGVVSTCIDRDGMLEGPDLEGLREVATLSPFPVIASGGVSSIADLEALSQLRPPRGSIAAAICGKALVAGRFSVAEGVAACRRFG